MNRLALALEDERIVREILAIHVPGIQVLAFGSRVTGRARRWSDLDLMLVAPEPIPFATTDGLREAFMDSDLPIRVDLVESARIDDEFRTLILRETVEIAPPTLEHVINAKRL